jgi:hypothetical protein
MVFEESLTDKQIDLPADAKLYCMQEIAAGFTGFHRKLIGNARIAFVMKIGSE